MTKKSLAAPMHLLTPANTPATLTEKDDAILNQKSATLEKVESINRKIEARIREQDNSGLPNLLSQKFLGFLQHWLDVMETDIPLAPNLKQFPTNPLLVSQTNSNFCKQPKFKPISRKKPKNLVAKIKVRVYAPRGLFSAYKNSNLHFRQHHQHLL